MTIRTMDLTQVRDLQQHCEAAATLGDNVLDDLQERAGFLVERIVARGDLERAASTLSSR
jgi:hypothetical protein